jgi:WD40 repeat protein
LAPSETAEPKAWADTICCQVIPDSTKMVCIYSNRSLFIWDFTDINKVGKYRSFLSHSACIWGVDTAKSVPGIPDSSFVTYAADGSIRFWNVSGEKIEASKANIYSKELVKCIQTSVEESKVDVSSTESIFLGDGGIRCAQVSPNGRLIASGDRTGSLRIYDLETNKLISCEEAHDAEILAVNFIQLNNDRTFLATGSRDRLIHIFESKGSTSNSFVLKNTLDDHTASITSLRFSRPNSSNAIIIASSAADKSILIRKMQDSNGSISRGQRTVTQGAIYDMSTDSSALSMIAVGQEKKLNFIDLSTAKISRSLKLDAEAGDQLSVHLDPSSTFAAISSQDKFIRVINTNNGEQIAKVSGHSEIVTGVKFLENGKRLVSVSGDGCIFIWKVSKDVVDMIEGKVAVQAKTKAAGSTTSSSSKTKTATASLRAIMNGEPIKVDHTKRKGKTSSAAPSAPRIKVTELNSVFNSAELPLWARRAIAAKPSPDELFLVSSDALDHSSSSGDLAPNRPLVRGAWANRLSAANNVVKIRTNDPKQPLIEYKLDDARESRRLSADFSSASAKQTIVDELNTTMSGDEDIIIFEQDDEKITSSKSSAASATPTRADETDTDDDFVDPAKLESMWSEFKEEPLDRMMKTNFDTLTDDFKPNPNRLSLSAKHRLVHTEPSTPAPEDVPAATSSSVPSTISNSSSTAASPSPSSPTSMTPTEPLSPQILAQSDSGVATPPPQPAASVSATSALTSDPTKPRDRKEVIAEEIERTRQRLMRLGMIGGKKEPEPARSSVNLSTASDVQPSNASMATESGLTSQSPPPTATAPSQQAYLVDEATDKVIHEIYTQDEIQAAAAAAAAVAVPPATQPAAEQDEGHTDSTGEDYELPVDEDLQDDEEYIGEDGEYDMELSEHAPTNDFLTGLSQAFDRTVDLYYELKRANRQDNIVDNIASFFSHVKSKLDKIVAEENERTVSAQTELLEKYSDALIAMVKAKLDK